MTSAAYRKNFKGIDFSNTPKPIPRRVPRNEKRSSLPTPMVVGDYQPYECPVTGKTVDGKLEHKINLEKTGCRILERGEFEDVKKNGKKRINESIDAAVDAAVDEVAKDFL